MLINYTKLKRYRYRKAPNIKCYCHNCGGEVEYCHIEKNVYCVRCQDCIAYTLIEVESWQEALRKVGEK